MVLKVSKIALKGCTRLFWVVKIAVTSGYTIHSRSKPDRPATGNRPEMSTLLASDYTLTEALTRFNTKPTYYLHIAAFHRHILALQNLKLPQGFN